MALHYLKYTFDLSDDDVLLSWVKNPYWQYFSGIKYFEHKLPISPSSMTRCRKRIGDAGTEELLKQTIEAGLKLNAVKATQLKWVNVDTTLQEKEISFPTDARLYDCVRERSVKEAKKRDIILRQNYIRLSRNLVHKQSRYAHARKMKRGRSCTRKLRTYLGRGIRDIKRKCLSPDKDLQSLLELPIESIVNSGKTSTRRTVFMNRQWSVVVIGKPINDMSSVPR